MKKLESIITSLIIIALAILCYKLLDNYFICGMSLYDLLKFPLTIWLAYFVVNTISKVEKSRVVKAIMGVTCGVVMTIFLSTSPQAWYIYLTKGICAIIAALLLYFYLKAKKLTE